MFKSRFLILLALIISGCASTGSTFEAGLDSGGQPVCLTDCAQIPSAIAKYTKAHDLTTEEDEIDYLFYRIRFSNDKFIRNGLEVDSASAADYLRWKMGWFEKHHGKKIDDDEKLVAWVMKGSETTGKPYVVILPDGSKHNMQFIMQNELNNLEAYQGEAPEIPPTF